VGRKVETVTLTITMSLSSHNSEQDAIDLAAANRVRRWMAHTIGLQAREWVADDPEIRAILRDVALAGVYTDDGEIVPASEGDAR
jgi:hypothetical protein